jgi:archaellum biogenesis ATPase FlaH
VSDKNDVISYLKRKKWAHRSNQNQFIVKTCPFCGNRDEKFYINKETGQFLCYKCDKTGNLYELKRSLGDLKSAEKFVAKVTDKPKIAKKKYDILRRNILLWHRNLLSSKKIRKRIKKKYGYNIKTIKDFRLGVMKKYGKYWISIPYYEGDPEKPTLVGLKYRTVPPAPKKFRREEGLKSSLYNVQNLDYELDFVFLFEGEADCATAHSLLNIPNSLGVTVGAKGFKEEWIDTLDNFERVYLVYDNDIAGQKGAETIARRLGLNRTYNILLPLGETNDSLDLNDWYLQGHTRDEFEDLMINAELFQVKDVVSLKSVLGDIEAELFFNKSLDTASLKTPWDSLNKKLGGFFGGDLIVLSGRAKVGKTTFALNLLGNYILDNIPSLLYCLEMRPKRITKKLIQWYRGVEAHMITMDDIIATEVMLSKKPLYFAHQYRFTKEEVMNTIRESVRRYALELVVFDHLHFLVRSENERSNVSSQVSSAVRDFKLLAEELDVPIILICQPKKIAGSFRKKMTIEDLRDSSSIGQDADTVIIVHRDRVENLYQGKNQKYDDSGEDEDNETIHEKKTQIIVEATRYNPGGTTTLWYDGALSRYFKDQEDQRRFLKNGRG